MVLYNSAKRSRMYEQTNNQPQGGGPKKAGLPPMVNYSNWWIPIYRNERAAKQSLSLWGKTKFKQPTCQNLPIGTNANIIPRCA
jgi:hypothetical protein